MIKAYSNFISFILSLPRAYKVAIQMIVDYLILVLCFWSSLSIRINAIYIAEELPMFLIFLGSLLAIPIFYFFGLYRSLIRFLNFSSQVTIMLSVSLYTFSWFLVVVMAGLVNKPYDFFVINWMLTTFAIGGIRFFARWLLSQSQTNVSNILIYGAGSAGLELQSSMIHNNEVNVVGFLDDDSTKHDTYIGSSRVYNPKKLDKLITKYNIDEVLIAIPSIQGEAKRDLLRGLNNFSIFIREVPALSDLVQGKLAISDLKNIRINDLLKRQTRKPDKGLIKQNITGKSVLITGAGGSIGSEISKEVFTNNPKNIILFDISEYALYLIERELLEQELHIEIISIIGDINDKSFFKSVIKRYKVQTIYHTAAYKHVPLVEKNILSGVKTNIFGTFAAISASIENEVECFVYISTDKAVRPTNVMGATKRFAELILQSISLKYKALENKTRISIVRFGNVLNSSGSVVPLFKKQIKKGGPITVTEPNIIRYFMTIKEAAELVIQAGAMGQDSEIFILDMDEPIKLIDLAKQMIKLSGKTLKNDKNPEGDIEIIFTGLRPGEKLYEELLVNNESIKTKHKKIFRANDSFLEWSILKPYIHELEDAIKSENIDKIINVLTNCIEGYVPYSELPTK